jgi:hypothetical protein
MLKVFTTPSGLVVRTAAAFERSLQAAMNKKT